jgi:hypothetical protein
MLFEQFGKLVEPGSDDRRIVTDSVRLRRAASSLPSMIFFHSITAGDFTLSVLLFND